MNVGSICTGIGDDNGVVRGRVGDTVGRTRIGVWVSVGGTGVKVTVFTKGVPVCVETDCDWASAVSVGAAIVFDGRTGVGIIAETRVMVRVRVARETAVGLAAPNCAICPVNIVPIPIMAAVPIQNKIKIGAATAHCENVARQFRLAGNAVSVIPKRIVAASCHRALGRTSIACKMTFVICSLSPRFRTRGEARIAEPLSKESASGGILPVKSA